MEPDTQPALLEIPVGASVGEPVKADGDTPKVVTAPRYIPLDRQQLRWGAIDLDQLIAVDHRARAIWWLTGRLDLSSFEQDIRSRVGAAGAPSHSPQVLVSVWIYAYSEGIGSARALERMMSHEPGLRWLCGDNPVNHHTLSDFRASQREKLNDLFATVLAALDQEGLLDLRTLMQDGTKMRALASPSSFHREPTLRKKQEQARVLVEELAKQGEKDSETQQEKRRRAARVAAAQQRLQRMEAVLEELQQRQQSAPASERSEVRVSDSEPETRKMRQSDGGFAPSYNVQITTEPKSKMVVSIEVSNACNDTHELVPALDRVQDQYGSQPQQMVADGGYATRENVEAAAGRNVELVAPWKEESSREAGAVKSNGLDAEFAPSQFKVDGENLQCPAGVTLVQIKTRKHHGLTCLVFEAPATQCTVCTHRGRCLRPGESARRIQRVSESEAMKAFLNKQQQPEFQALYKTRKAVAEFPQLRFKGNWKITQFSVRGLAKVSCEAIWIALAHNVSQWFRLSWIPQRATS